jgi:hypothetical protein
VVLVDLGEDTEVIRQQEEDKSSSLKLVHTTKQNREKNK